MTAVARRLVRLAACAALAAAVLGVAPGEARATTATIKRSVSNLLLFPVDFVMSPYVGAKALYTGWTSSDDTPAVKIAYPAFGLPWNIGLNLGTSLLRGVAGCLEFLPGLVLIPFKADMQPLFDLSINNNAVLDQEVGGIKIRAGVDYVSPSEY